MQLTDLLLDRQLYKSAQDITTKDSTYLSSNPTTTTPYIASGNAVIDVNTNAMQINGQVIEPGTIPPDVLDINNWGWTQTCSFTVDDADTVSWSGGIFKSASGTTYTISAGTTGNMSAKTYVYLDILSSTTTYKITTSVTVPVGLGKVLIAVCENGASAATYALVQATQIVGDNILANTISAGKLNVGYLSAISADLGSITAGTVTGTLIQTDVVGSAQRIAIDGTGTNNNLTFWENANQVIGIGTDAGVAMYVRTTTAVNDGFHVVSSVAGNGFYFSNSANVASNAIRIIQDNTGSSNSGSGVFITKAGEGEGIYEVISNGAVGLYIEKSGTDNAVYIQNSGTGNSVEINDTATSGSTHGLKVTYATKTGSAVYATSSGASAATVYTENTGNVYALHAKSNGTGNAAIYVEKAVTGPMMEFYQSCNSATASKGLVMAIDNAGAGLEYAFQFSGSEHVGSAVGGTQDQKIRILVGATTYYIPCYTA